MKRAHFYTVFSYAYLASPCSNQGCLLAPLCGYPISENGVATNVHYKPLPMMSGYKAYGWDIKDFPNAYHLYHNEITLPLHTLLSNEDVEIVIQTLRSTLEEMKLL